VLEEQAEASEDAADARDLEHEMQLRREVAKKQQLEDEAIMLARDVRVLRQRRRLAEEEAAGAWRAVEQAIQNRQQTELCVEELKLKQRIADATKPELDEVRAALYEKVAAATQQCDDLAAQLEERQTKLSGSRPSADGDPEEEMKRKMSFGNKASRALSFRGKKNREAATAGSGGGEGEHAPELRKGGSSGGLLRSMSFKRAAGGEGGAPTAAGEALPELKLGGSSVGLLRSMSFKRAASAEPGALKKSASDGVAKAAGGEGGAAAAAASAAAGEVAPELKKGGSSGGLLRSLSFRRAASSTELRTSAAEGVSNKELAPAPTQEPKKADVGGLIRTMSFSRQKAEAKAFVPAEAEAAGRRRSGRGAREAVRLRARRRAHSGLVRKLSFGRKKTESP